MFKKYGAECINQQDVFGMTALHSAAQAGYEKIVCYLLNQGADATLANCNGRLAFELAHDAGHKKIRDCLASLYQEAVIRNDLGRSSGDKNKPNDIRKVYNTKNMTVCYSNL